LNGDGDDSDSTSPRPTFTYTESGVHSARLRITDPRGVSAWSDPISIAAYDEAPTAAIAAPLPALTWRVGDAVGFSGSATDPKQGKLPPSAMTWTLVLHHCPAGCHTHVIQSFPGVSSGTFSAPDHEYPSYLELQLSAVNALGIPGITSVVLLPKTVSLSFSSSPPGLTLDAGSGNETTPFSKTVIVGSANTVSAPARQRLGGKTYLFRSWSDGESATHLVHAPSAPAGFTAIFDAERVLPVPPPVPAPVRAPSHSPP
jgi:PKD repeat protein